MHSRNSLSSNTTVQFPYLEVPLPEPCHCSNHLEALSVCHILRKVSTIAKCWEPSLPFLGRRYASYLPSRPAFFSLNLLFWLKLILGRPKRICHRVRFFAFLKMTYILVNPPSWSPSLRDLGREGDILLEERRSLSSTHRMGTREDGDGSQMTESIGL